MVSNLKENKMAGGIKIYSPCMECKLRYNKEYSAECDNKCALLPIYLEG